MSWLSYHADALALAAWLLALFLLGCYQLRPDDGSEFEPAERFVPWDWPQR